jgi:hypothetical protein
MALLNYSSPPAKGLTVTVTLDKNLLVSIAAIESDAWWTDDDGDIVQAIVTLKTSPGNGKIVLNFDFAQNPCTAQLTLPLYCRDVLQISKIVLVDTMGDKISINRSQIITDIPNLQESEIDTAGPGNTYNLDEGDFLDVFSGTTIDEGSFNDTFSGVSIDSGTF